jgi:hypothetical protein
MNTIIGWWKNHGTKILGFAQVTMSVLAVSTDVLSPRMLKLAVMVSGLLVAWRGYVNSANVEKPGA